MSLDLEVLRQSLQGDYGSAARIRSWYRSTHRQLRRLGFIPQGRGNFMNGKFRVMIRFASDNNESLTAFVRVTGPMTALPPKNLYRIPHLKFLTLNAQGKLCKIPAKSWDRKRKSRSITEL